MSQAFRDMLANRKFAVPLIALLFVCFVGLVLVGAVLLLRPGSDDGGRSTALAGEDITPSVTAVNLVTAMPAATSTATPRPSPTLVPLATVDVGSAATAAPTAGEGGEATPVATMAATAAAANADAENNTDGDGELADTGLGWGLILFAGSGLAALTVAARRLRLARD